MHCTRSLVPIALAIAVVAAAASAQSGRTMKRLSPVVIGGTAAMAMQHPTAIAGNVYALAVCSPSFPGTLPLAIPGVIQGVLRLDPVAFGWLQFGVLDASGRTAPLSFAVPNDPLLVSASFDVQGMDLDAAGLITLTDDELETQVAAPPPPSLNMVAIAPGTFPMGSATYATSGFPWAAYESPVHAVTITQPFWIGKFEVTQAQYQALVGANPSAFPGASRPVEQVSWNQAVAFCDALTVQEAAAGRLHGNGWASVQAAGGSTLYLERVGAAWQLRAARRPGWEIGYGDWRGTFPGRVRLHATSETLDVDLSVSVSQLETNVDLDPVAVQVTVPADALDVTIEELRRAGPLRQ